MPTLCNSVIFIVVIIIVVTLLVFTINVTIAIVGDFTITAI